MKLGFDIDGIVANMAQAMVDFINKKYELDHTVDVFNFHELWKNKYVDDEKLNRQVTQDMYDEIIDNSEALLKMSPYFDAASVLQVLKKNGHSLHFITARRDVAKKSTVDWFRKNKIPFDTIHVTGSTPRPRKGMLGRNLNLDFYIDDQTEYLEEMYMYKNRWRKGLFLFTRPWNENEAVDLSKFKRISSWKELNRYLGIYNR